ncbi:MAG: diguanylate cyclase [Chloroflexi bacterium]|nr:diguanylate cyclase [Chloroflexota bacterium]HEV8053958.1 diguanylate cyclase [Candidatus Limnocylindrales bacterium]
MAHQTGVRRGPQVFLLVYGFCLFIFALTAVGLAFLAASHVATGSARAALTADTALVRQVARTELGRLLAARSGADADLQGRAGAALQRFAADQNLLSARIIAPDGSLLVGSGELSADDSLLSAALAGIAGAEIRQSADASTSGPSLVEYVPLLLDGSVAAVVELHRPADGIVADEDAARRDVVVVSAFAALALAVVLYFVFRAAQARLSHQTRELLEATRRDALTGLLNHGAIVGLLRERIDQARETDEPVGVALIDVDNFRLLNETHGHGAGDEALCTLVDAMRGEGDAWRHVGRYGPDEFLAISRAGQARELEVAVLGLRERLAATVLQFGGSERLPLTVSAGIAHFPFHAPGATELLSAATMVLGEAKASGGNAARVSGAWKENPSHARSSFDILTGLVGAVDTKDRYTKRHSEDVARYALLLADHVRLDRTSHETIRMAGLLHDVGKIGIPDDILRKPSALTAYEMEIVKQHVALGDLIVRDLPNLWTVRAGIRHHHERWDGTGYLDGLRGERIPLIARVLAVADAFSAMTTTRPYRVALPVDEALDRVRKAAGTQLDPELAMAFVAAIDTPQGRSLIEELPQDAASPMANAATLQRPGQAA